ncbi:MAG: S4 domain-containing protein [Pseudomonadota bacterium]
MTEPAPGLRVDKWLWRARFFKTRALAGSAAAAGLRINGARTDKPHALVRPGDALTFKQARRVRVIRVLAIGERRGPASEAATLYEDLEAENSPSPGT